jgi:hypothetical protein
MGEEQCDNIDIAGPRSNVNESFFELEDCGGDGGFAFEDAREGIALAKQGQDDGMGRIKDGPARGGTCEEWRVENTVQYHMRCHRTCNRDKGPLLTVRSFNEGSEVILAVLHLGCGGLESHYAEIINFGRNIHHLAAGAAVLHNNTNF